VSKTNYSTKYFKDRDHLDLHLAESIKILASGHKFKKILDVGCGTGKLVSFLNKNGFQAKGCDKFPKAVSIAQKNNNKNSIIKAPATNLPFSNRSFDLITSISAIEHLTPRETKQFLQETHRILKHKGLVFIVTPNFNSPFRYLRGKNWFAYKDPTHINFFTKYEVSKQLNKVGFKNISFRHNSAYDIPFDWYLPKALRKLPMPAKNILNYLMVTSPLSTFRDSLWVSAQK